MVESHQVGGHIDSNIYNFESFVMNYVSYQSVILNKSLVWIYRESTSDRSDVRSGEYVSIASGIILSVLAALLTFSLSITWKAILSHLTNLLGKLLLIVFPVWNLSKISCELTCYHFGLFSSDKTAIVPSSFIRVINVHYTKFLPIAFITIKRTQSCLGRLLTYSRFFHRLWVFLGQLTCCSFFWHWRNHS